MFRRVYRVLTRPRVRNFILIVGGYQLYDLISTSAVLYKTFSASRHRPGETVLDVDLGVLHLVPRETGGPLSSADQLGIDHFVEGLRRARDDPRVTALVVRGASQLGNAGLAGLGEARAAIRAFSEGPGGKLSILHAPDGLGGGGNGTVPLYFASAFDYVHAPPGADVVVPGLSFATMFFRGLLDTVGVSAKVVARKEYKTAANALTETSFTEAQRESTEALLRAIMDGVIDAVAKGRRLPKETVANAIEQGVMSAEEASALGLVDDPLHRDELPAAVRAHLDDFSVRRAAERADAVKEWREAMGELKEAWSHPDRESDLDLWDRHDWLAEISRGSMAAKLVISMADSKSEQATANLKAELRALRAHLAWLNTCPWEECETVEQKLNSVFYQVPTSASVVQFERKLCMDGITALEMVPAVIDELRESGEAKDMKKVEEKTKELLKWVRSMAKAKAFAARIYDTLLDIEKEAAEALSDKSEAVNVSLSAETLVPNPMSFLLGEPAEVVVTERKSKEEASKNSAEANSDETHEKLKAVDQGIVASVLSSVQKGKKDTKDEKSKRRLQYIRFNDYSDLLARESRATARQLMRWRLFPQDEESILKADGLVSTRERKTLQRLRDWRVPFCNPWRMPPSQNAPVVAVIHIDGVINDVTAQNIRAYIRRADKDYRVKAIVLRIDSPGGSAIASDIIARAVEVAKKPVVSSMGNVCASGGYYIAAPSDKIMCDPGTITGSIGVILQTFNTSNLYEKAGISLDRVDYGRFAKYYGSASSVLEWDPEFSSQIDKQIDNMYNTFVKIVARGRKMNFDAAERVARGRVWAGSDALRLGLVDQYGGLEKAIEEASTLAAAAPDSEVRPYNYPSKAMLVEERLRRGGVLPGRIDEEGDEAVPQKGRPRRRWFQFSPLEGEIQNPRDAGTGDQKEGNNPEAFVAGVLSRGMADSKIVQWATRSLLELADDYLLRNTSSSLTSRFLDATLGVLVTKLGGNVPAKTISEQVRAVEATAGRPAAIAPGIFLDD